MKINHLKSIVVVILTDSFVGDYNINKKIMDKLNLEFLNKNIPFSYTYDDFCIELLNKTLANIDYMDIHSAHSIDEFYEIFSKFNRGIKEIMFTHKLFHFILTR